MKLLVLALYAQFRVGAGNEDNLGDRNGIRQSTQFVVETLICGFLENLRTRIKPACGESYE